MKLSEILDQLSYGELSQITLGNADGTTFGITDENRYRVINHINLGLTELHKRFLLKEGRTDLYLATGLRTYTVESDDDDILKIERVLKPTGEELPLDREGEPEAVFTTAYNTLRLSEDMDTNRLVVVYRANHPLLSPRDAAKNPDQVEVALPRSHLEPLLLFVASRVFNPMGMNAAQFHDGNNYYAKYEQACQLLENGGYQTSLQEERTRFELRGFV